MASSSPDRVILPYVFSAFVATLLHFFGGVTIPSHDTDWAQATLEIPPSVTWHTGDQFTSGWVMSQARGGSFTQVGWIEGPNIPLHAFVYSSQSGTALPAAQNFALQPLAPGGHVTVAVSCDFGSNTYRDWIRTNGVWNEVSHISLGGSCGAWGSQSFAQNESALPYGAQLPTYNLPTPFTGIVVNTTSGVVAPQVRMG